MTYPFTPRGEQRFSCSRTALRGHLVEQTALVRGVSNRMIVDPCQVVSFMSQSSGDGRQSSRPVRSVMIRRVEGEESENQPDLLAVEEPLEIRLSYVKPSQKQRRQRTISVTMRTPGHDRELAAGFLLTEGIIQSARDILAIYSCRNGNRVRVHLREDVVVDLKRLRRNFYTSSSCGVCGKTSLESVEACVRQSLTPGPKVPSRLIHSLPAKLRAAQSVFDRTGGLHASALFNAAGDLLSLREDVGRHNALDKLIGQQLLLQRLPLVNTILVVSGRASFELVQKAVMAGIPIVAAVGAPSSLAVELAMRHDQTLLGFVRDDRFNVYNDVGRINANSM